MRRRAFLALSGACLVCSCSGAVHQLPQVSESGIALAMSEVQAGGLPQRRVLSDEEVLATLQYATARIQLAAVQLCHEVDVGVCDWTFHASRDRSVNAGALPNGHIVVNRGVVEYAANEEEVCLVIAHEMGHQVANHVRAGVRNQVVGAMIGAVLLGVVGALASQGAYNSAQVTRTAAETGSNLGAMIGRISYSKEQEREADYFAALILYRAGVDLDKARGFLVTMARGSRQKETGLLDTHPAGPERLAAWDRAVQEIRAADGRLPPRKP